MFQTIKNAIKTPDVRKRLLYLLLLIVIFRIGCFIPVPGVDLVALSNQEEAAGIAGLIDLFSGGAFSRFSIFAMSVTPYITASIVMQLLGMIIPSLERLTKEGGEQGRQKINKYTKLLTIALSLVEGIGLYLSYKSAGIFVNPGFLTGCLVVFGLVAGTAILMWLGQQITTKGIGNGISILIFVGIVSRLPYGVRNLWQNIMTSDGFSTTGFLLAIAVIIGAIILVGSVVYVQLAERKIPVQYSKKVVGRKMIGAQSTHIPLKLAMAGVMPVIFASSFMTFPAMIIQLFVNDIATQTGFLAALYKLSLATSTASGVSWGYSVTNAVIYLLLIVGFTFFYTFAVFNPAEVSSNIKKNGGFIPGIRAGKPTTEYLSSVMTKVTLFGGFFLALIAVVPMLLRFIPSLDVTFGGTSILIVVGVALEVMQKLEAQLAMRHYKGFLG